MSTTIGKIIQQAQAASSYRTATGFGILETGFDLPTCIDLGRWCDVNGGQFTSVGLNIKALETLHERLEACDTARVATLLLQDPSRWLSKLTWINIVFLNDPTRNLDGTRELYRLAASAGARTIVLTDYQSRAALAVREARDHGWNYKTEIDLDTNRAYFILSR